MRVYLARDEGLGRRREVHLGRRREGGFAVCEENADAKAPSESLSYVDAQKTAFTPSSRHRAASMAQGGIRRSKLKQN